MTLLELPIGAGAKVTQVRGTSAIILRLMEMGLVPGARVCVKKHAPFGGPLQLELNDYLLSIRREEAHQFVVAPAE